MRWKRTGAAVAAVAVASTAAVVFAPATEPPSSIWYDGKRSVPAGDGSIPDSVSIQLEFRVHCGMDTRPRSASGLEVPCFGDSLLWMESPPLLDRVASLFRRGTWGAARVRRHVYALSPTRQDHRDEDGTWWFRYDLRADPADE